LIVIPALPAPITAERLSRSAESRNNQKPARRQPRGLELLSFVRFWPKADILFCTANVRFPGNKGHRPLTADFASSATPQKREPPVIPLQPNTSVDAVAKDITTVDNDIALMNAHPKFNSLIMRYVCVTLDHPFLDFGGATHGVEDAHKLSEEPIACIFDDTPPVLRDFGFN
jgi:hypothetical protein